MQKNWKNPNIGSVVEWSSRNEGFKDKKRTGRPKVLNEAAEKVLKKAKYKRGNSTRQLSQPVSKQRPCWGKNHRLEVHEKRRLEAAETAKETSAHAKQRAVRLKFAKPYKSLTTEEWDDFLFTDECPKYLFQLPNPKNDIV